MHRVLRYRVADPVGVEPDTDLTFEEKKHIRHNFDPMKFTLNIFLSIKKRSIRDPAV